MKPIGMLAPMDPPVDHHPRPFSELHFPITSVVKTAADSSQMHDVRNAGDLVILAASGRVLPEVGVSYVAWAGSSGSFALGHAGGRARAATIESTAGVPATSTSVARLDALAAFGVDEVDVDSPYPPRITETFEHFREEANIRVAATTHAATSEPSISKHITAEDVMRHLIAPLQERLVIAPDTAITGREVSEGLAEPRWRSVLFANQWTNWDVASRDRHVLRRVGLGVMSGVARTTS